MSKKPATQCLGGGAFPQEHQSLAVSVRALPELTGLPGVPSSLVHFLHYLQQVAVGH